MLHIREYHTVNVPTGTTSVLTVNHDLRTIESHVTTQQRAEILMHAEKYELKPRYVNRRQRKGFITDLLKHNYTLTYKKWAVLQ